MKKDFLNWRNLESRFPHLFYRVSFVIILLLTSRAVFSQSYSELISMAKAAYISKEYSISLSFYKKAFALEAKDPGDLYNGACSAALSQDPSEAFRFLDLSIKMGWINIHHLKKDMDLVSLHTDARWNDLITRLQQKVDVIEANYDKPLQHLLLEIYDDDQTIRHQYVAATKKFGYKNPTVDSLGSIMEHKDSVNLLKITRILDEKGWIGKDKVGLQATQTIFLVIQHADLKTQQKYLPLMRDVVKKGNASAGNLALLEDRVAIGEGRKQIYGSQIGRNSKTGEFYVLPLNDPDNVDQRRAEMGLGPLAEYVKDWNIRWDPNEYKKRLAEIERWSKGQN